MRKGMTFGAKTTKDCPTCGDSFTRPQFREAEFCSYSCSSRSRAGDPVARFWSHVNKDGPVPAHRPELGPCWVWTSTILNMGYGQIRVSANKRVLAHRYAWELEHGPTELDVLHKCDRRNCVRESHLWEGTSLDNNRDMVDKGRQRYTGPKSPVRGESHPRAKLTEERVVDIFRLRYENGGMSQSLIAKRAGVSQPLIGMVLRREIWSHVLLPECLEPKKLV